MKSNTRSCLIRIFSGAKKKVYYRKERNKGAGEKRLHAVENLFDTIKPITGEIPIPPCRVSLRKRDKEFVEHYLKTRLGGADMGAPLVAFNPNVSIPESSRHWPPEYFASLGDRIIREIKGKVLLIGGAEDREYCEGIGAMMEEKPLITAGELTLGQSGALLMRCATLVSGDTGPMHLAAAVGTRVVALFGSMDPRRAGPYGEGHTVIIKSDLPCIICEKKVCPLGTTQCMKDISVDEVCEAVRKYVSSPD